MDDENIGIPSGTPEKKDKSIIDIKPDWPLWQRTLATMVNSFPVFIWMVLTVLLMWYLGGNPELVGLRNAYLNLVIPAIGYGILSLNAGLALVSWFFPYFSVKRIMREGTPMEKVGIMIFWGLMGLGSLSDYRHGGVNE